MQTVNIYFYEGGTPWHNAVGDMAKRVVAGSEKDLRIVFGASEDEGDLIHYFDIGPAMQGKRAGIMGVHQISPRIEGRKLANLQPALERHKAAIVLTNEMARMVMPYAKCSVIPGGVAQIFEPQHWGDGPYRGIPVIGVCGHNRGNSLDTKGAQTCIAIAKAAGKALRWCIAGSGWFEFAEYLRSAGIEFTQWDTLAYTAMPEFYQSLDVFLCASREEGGGLPILEAMACGVPVVSTPVGYAMEKALWKTGYLRRYPFVANTDNVGSAGEAAKHIVEFLRERPDNQKHWAQYRGAVSQCVRDYTWAKYVERHKFYYREVLAWQR